MDDARKPLLHECVSNYDNIALDVDEEEYEYWNVQPVVVADIHPPPPPIEKTDSQYLVRIPRRSRHKCAAADYIDLPAGMLDIVHMASTRDTTGFVTANGDFYIVQTRVTFVEKIANCVRHAIAGDNVFCLVTNVNTCVFVCATTGTIVDIGAIAVKQVHVVHDRFYMTTECGSLCMFENGSVVHFTELDTLVADVLVNRYTVTVLTIDGRVWMHGDEAYAYITSPCKGRGFVLFSDDKCVTDSTGCSNIPIAVAISQSMRAGAVLMSDKRVWAWGDVRYGGSPTPGWVRGWGRDRCCERLLSTATSIIAVTDCRQLWAWSNSWFKTYCVADSDYAVVSCINPIFNGFVMMRGGRTSWMVKACDGKRYMIGASNTVEIGGAHSAVVNLDYGWMVDNAMIYAPDIEPTCVVVGKPPNVTVDRSMNMALVQLCDRVIHITVHRTHIDMQEDLTPDGLRIITGTHMSPHHGVIYFTDRGQVYLNGSVVYTNSDPEHVEFVGASIDNSNIVVRMVWSHMPSPPSHPTTSPPLWTPSSSSSHHRHMIIENMKAGQHTAPTEMPTSTLTLTSTSDDSDSSGADNNPLPLPPLLPITDTATGVTETTPFIQIEPVPDSTTITSPPSQPRGTPVPVYGKSRKKDTRGCTRFVTMPYSKLGLVGLAILSIAFVVVMMTVPSR